MKKILILFTFLLAFTFVKAQNPVIITQQYKFLKPPIANIYLIGTTDTAARKHYVDSLLSARLFGKLNKSDSTIYTSVYQNSLKISSSEKGSANGIATLDMGSKIPVSQLPSTLMIYKGLYDATTNIPSLSNGTGVSGTVYQISNTTDPYIGNRFGVQDTLWSKDFLMYNGSAWEVSAWTDGVKSVNAKQGVVSLKTSDIPEQTNLYYTDARSRAAHSAGTGISYNSSTGVITNSAPDQTVSLSNGTGITVSGTYPSFTITNSAPSSGGTVTSVSGTSPIVSSGGNTPVISINAANTSVAGSMSAADKSKLNGITTNASNTILGYGSGSSISTGSSNTILGLASGSSLTTGDNNAIIGDGAGVSLVSGYQNTFVGHSSGHFTTSGDNTFVGNYSGLNNNTGNHNTFLGSFAGDHNTDGSNNVFFGYLAGSYFTGSSSQNLHSNNSVVIGVNSYPLAANGTNEIAIGYNSIGHGSNTATWGNTSITDHYFAGMLHGTFSGSSTSVANSLTFSNAGTGDASGSTFNGSAAKTISYNSIGAAPAVSGGYLPLSGGTLTGGLNGTIATLALNAATTSQITLNNTYSSSTQQTHIGTFVGGTYLSTNWYYNGSQTYDDNTKKSASIVLNGDGSINLNTNNVANSPPTTSLTLASTGGVSVPSTTPSTSSTTGALVVGGGGSGGLGVAGNGYFGGNITATGATFTTGAGSGKVWTSDASGNGSWSSSALPTLASGTYTPTFTNYQSISSSSASGPCSFTRIGSMVHVNITGEIVPTNTNSILKITLPVNKTTFTSSFICGTSFMSQGATLLGQGFITIISTSEAYISLPTTLTSDGWFNAQFDYSL